MSNYTNKRPRTFDVYVGNIPVGLQEVLLKYVIFYSCNLTWFHKMKIK